jgi:hypothetical protein
VYLTLESGAFERVEIDPRTAAIQITLGRATPAVPAAKLRIELPGAAAGMAYQPTTSLQRERDVYVVPLTASPAVVRIAPGR